MNNIQYEKERAKLIAVEMKGSVQEYALNFLHIVNNAREYPNMIINVKNDEGNKVYVACTVEHVEAVKDYLSQFGEIVYVVDIWRYDLYPRFNSQLYNEIMNESEGLIFTFDFL